MTSEEFIAKLSILSEKERGYMETFLDFLTHKAEQERLVVAQYQPIYDSAKSTMEKLIKDFNRNKSADELSKTS